MMNKKRNTKWSGAKLLIVIPFAMLTIGLFAKSVNFNGYNFAIPENVAPQEEEVVMPEFKGGQQALFEYLAGNIRYPEKAKNENIAGKVFISFVIASDGKVKDVKVVKSDNEIFNDEAERVIKSMPDWTPGTKNGKKADIELTLPINFQL